MDFDDEKGQALNVKIGGETVKVFAAEGPEYIQRMANYINYIIDDFNNKKGRAVRQSLLLVYAALELCDTLFREKDKKLTPSERSYEKMFQMEVFSHKRTQDALETAAKRLEEMEAELLEVRSELNDFLKAFELLEAKEE